MKIKFTKMHGTMNDFIMLDNLSGKFDNLDWPELARKLCVRRASVGADAIILICPSEKADFKMAYFNADGSPAEMCGNGIRCLAKYVYDRKISDKKKLDIETLAGIIKTEAVKIEDMKVKTVKVDMGTPKIKEESIEVDGKTYNGVYVSMGNPHFINFVDNHDFDYRSLGKKMEFHRKFPDRINVEFIKVNDRKDITMRVWERGSGETFACGTGACASAVASAWSNKTGKEVKVHLLGGELIIVWSDDNHVFLTGPAEEVYRGELEVGV